MRAGEYTRYISINDEPKGDPTRTPFPENWMKEKLGFQGAGLLESAGVLQPPRAVEMVQRRVISLRKALHLLVE